MVTVVTIGVSGSSSVAHRIPDQVSTHACAFNLLVNSRLTPTSSTGRLGRLTSRAEERTVETQHLRQGRRPQFTEGIASLERELNRLVKTKQATVGEDGDIAVAQSSLAALSEVARDNGFAVKLLGSTKGDDVAIEFRGLVKIDRLPRYSSAGVDFISSTMMCRMD